MGSLHNSGHSNHQAEEYSCPKKTQSKGVSALTVNKPGRYQKKGNGGMATGKRAVFPSGAGLPELDKFLIASKFYQFLRSGATEMVLENNIDEQSRGKRKQQDDKQ